ncbi:uncharacterized protein LOC116604664 [Nematostella vectensis]|uniref:uncharacterized protein LOC116604664 n=1 Tax=Nematostella vectensis TaxID=45351 RepID=UPI0020779689|nr:uncharacterized protein LOC116604664 [Nematostella vectensis]
MSSSQESLSKRHARCQDAELLYFPQWTSFPYDELVERSPYIRENGRRSSVPEFPGMGASLLPPNENARIPSKYKCIGDKNPWHPPANVAQVSSKQDEQPSQLVDALKVGLADILSTPRKDDIASYQREPGFGFYDDVAPRGYNPFKRGLQDFVGGRNNSSFSHPDFLDQYRRSEVYDRQQSSSGDEVLEDGVSDLSTTESRESHTDLENRVPDLSQGEQDMEFLTDSSCSERREGQCAEELPGDADTPKEHVIAKLRQDEIDEKDSLPENTNSVVIAEHPIEVPDDPPRIQKEPIIVETPSLDVVITGQKQDIEMQEPGMDHVEASECMEDDNQKQLDTTEELIWGEVDNCTLEKLECAEAEQDKDIAEMKTPESSPKKKERFKEMPLESRTGDSRKLGSTLERVAHPQPWSPAPPPPPTPPFNPWLDSPKHSYAEVLKRGLSGKSQAQRHLKPMTLFPSKSPKDSKKSSRKSRNERRSRSESSPKKERDQREGNGSPRKNEYPSCSGGATSHTQSTVPVSYSQPMKQDVSYMQGKRDHQIFRGRQNEDCKEKRDKNSRRNREEKISDDSSDTSQTDAKIFKVSEEIMREKIKTEQIAMVLQEAKLTLAKLTTECLGSYEKVFSLKTRPATCCKTLQALQTQEVNKALYMKELADRLHQLTEFGIGNAEEFREIKDILNSLHYLQMKDKYFIELTGRKLRSAENTHKLDADKSMELFFFVSLVLVTLACCHQSQWLAAAFFSLLIGLLLYYEGDMFSRRRTHSKENDTISEDED